MLVKAYYSGGLKEVIKDKLSNIGKPKTLNKLVEQATEIDERSFDRAIERGRGKL